jgi:hypothetical protein
VRRACLHQVLHIIVDHRHQLHGLDLAFHLCMYVYVCMTVEIQGFAFHSRECLSMYVCIHECVYASKCIIDDRQQLHGIYVCMGVQCLWRSKTAYAYASCNLWLHLSIHACMYIHIYVYIHVCIYLKCVCMSIADQVQPTS